MSKATSNYDAVVFAGGGCRCFWQLGFWAETAEPLQLAPKRVGGVSAGAVMACAIFADIAEDMLGEFVRRAAENQSNFYPKNLLSDAPVLPHERIYTETMEQLTSRSAFHRLMQGPEIRVLVGRAPDWTGPTSAIALGVLGEGAERLLGEEVHMRWGRRFGFEGEVVRVNDCRSPRDLVDLMLHTSCTPPALPLYERDGRPVFDGGIVDNVPTEVVEPARSMLVLLSRHFPEEKIPKLEGRTYVQPSEPIPIMAWDYASPDLIDETYELGRRDGRAFVEASS